MSRLPKGRQSNDMTSFLNSTLYAAVEGQAAVTTSLLAIPSPVREKALSIVGREEGGAIQLHHGIGVFQWKDTIAAHVDDVPENHITMGLVLVNDGDFVFWTEESPLPLPLSVGSVWRLNARIRHQGVRTTDHAAPQFVGILWDFPVQEEPTPEWFASEALAELMNWVAGNNPDVVNERDLTGVA